MSRGNDFLRKPKKEQVNDKEIKLEITQKVEVSSKRETKQELWDALLIVPDNNHGIDNPNLPARENNLQVTLGVWEESFNLVLAHNRLIPVIQADPISRSNARKSESVKCECLLMFPITVSGQRAPLIQQEPPKLSQATGLKATANRKSSFKDTRRVLAVAEKRVHKSTGPV